MPDIKKIGKGIGVAVGITAVICMCIAGIALVDKSIHTIAVGGCFKTPNPFSPEIIKITACKDGYAQYTVFLTPQNLTVSNSVQVVKAIYPVETTCP